MEPLNIGKALQGHPVRLRNGEKAYIRHREVELLAHRPLMGYWKPNSSVYVPVSWTEKGESTAAGNLDIVGMWKAAPLAFLYWGEINRKFNYLAKDKDGEWYAYVDKPTKQEGYYVMGESCAPLRAMSDKIFPACDWDESVMERPR